jgi:hypothetical protein
MLDMTRARKQAAEDARHWLREDLRIAAPIDHDSQRRANNRVRKHLASLSPDRRDELRREWAAAEGDKTRHLHSDPELKARAWREWEELL